MSDRAGLDGQARLRVTVEFGEHSRELAIAWSLADIAAHLKLEYARIFLVPLETGADRSYLELIDGHPRATVLLPGTVPAGEYAIEVDGYGSASWGDGRLDARGRSAAFTITR
ncbi:hypothetical protein ACFVUS_36570 [Nocardia sp. NPDC058058]|uniref:hypothetical protein n=1 Tax=Nocardia sp. NPDC058058 TaxID=3346317 RepID=UPI0036D9C953